MRYDEGLDDALGCDVGAIVGELILELGGGFAKSVECAETRGAGFYEA